ncbi:hypothetical protein G6F57_000318 [Rhizopus arrhizus]|uniref:RWD domain-containing protein n=1 Tax=Rhizopus oryzae TaxID=64495 RepID=A0A9P7BPV9_RHIOR|nr:hypothetical protein G6F23_004774 [Rhizopus arrhizus]KAG1415908.1 hypothetical protein G6F58_006245 [Rhizopus delemar]KAG0764117.1 hypothetical protein G6F24_005472 [Rhizopus arrhizus]KAG0781841.1 hypothetical protein G6F22_009385 [Rhizopus arrhizus]KAG0795096.1 hypothetical protein G6F21_002376 [Rhizopus arrhizus]
MHKVPFPLIIPIEEEKKIYKGYIPIQKQEYLIQVQLGPGGQLFGTKELNELIDNKKTLIENKLHEAKDIMTFLLEFKEIIEESITSESNEITTFQPMSSKISHIYQELSIIGFDKVHYMSETMDEILFKTIYHELKVTLPSNYPFAPPQIIAYIPTQIESSLSIADIVNRHEQIIHQHQKLFDCLDDLDKHMRILEPEKPNRSDTWRKIALGHHCSLYLEITDPMSPFDKPQIRLFGSEKRVENLRKAWDHTFWDKEVALHVNLLNIFQLVPDEKQGQEDYTNTTDIECGICYSYKLENGEAPETILASIQSKYNTEF